MTTRTMSKATTWTRDHGLDTAPIRVSGYTSPEYYDQEIELLWKKTWIEVGRLHTVREPGSFFVKDLSGLDLSILVTRAKDGSLNAFHNSCAHRCSRLFFGESRGQTKMLTCPFHGWTYHLDGRLALVTDEENFFDVDKDSYGLTPIRVEAWEDFVFICLDPEPRETLPEFLGDLYSSFAGYPFAEMTQVYSWSAEINCNWKVIRDGFLESYHLRSLHKDTISSSFFTPENPYCHSVDYGTATHHVQRTQVSSTLYQPSPMELLAFSTGGKSISDRPDGLDLDLLPPLVNGTLGRTKPSDAAAVSPSLHTTSVFPSFLIALFPDFFTHFNWRPVSVDRSILEMRQAMRPPRSATERWAQEVSIGSLYATALEDIVTAEGIQQNMKAGARKTVALQDEEFAIRHSHLTGQRLVGPYPED